jgi:hypothetical protein
MLEMNYTQRNLYFVGIALSLSYRRTLEVVEAVPLIPKMLDIRL